MKRFTNALAVAIVMFSTHALIAQSFETTIGEPQNRHDVLARSHVASSSGNLVMIGSSAPGTVGLPGPTTQMAGLLAEMDQSGAPVFGKYFAFEDAATRVWWPTTATSVVEDHGIYYVTGKVTDPATGDEDILVAKLDPATGTAVANRYDFSSATRECGVKIKLINGDYYVTGITNEGGQTIVPGIPEYSTFLMQLNTSLSSLWAGMISFGSHLISLEVKDMDYNPMAAPPTNYDLMLVGHVRGDDLPSAWSPGVVPTGHTISFSALIDIGNKLMPRFHLYWSVGPLGTFKEGLKFDAVHFDAFNSSVGTGQGWSVTGEVETGSGSSGGYYFYIGHLYGDGFLHWEKSFKSPHNQFRDSYGYGVKGRVHPVVSTTSEYVAIGTAKQQDGTTDIMMVKVEYDNNSATPVVTGPIILDAKEDEGRDVEFLTSGTGNNYYGFGFSTAFSSTNEYLAFGSPTYMSTCHTTTGGEDVGVATWNIEPFNCMYQIPVGWTGPIVCLDPASPSVSSLNYEQWDAEHDRPCESPVPLTGIAPGLKTQSTNSMVVYPNPSSSLVFFESEAGGEFDITVYSIAGKEVWKGHGDGRLQVDVSKWAAGLYTYQVVAGEHTFKGKFTVN